MAPPELDWDDAVELLITAMAAVIFLIALLAYGRTRTTRMIIFAAAFAALLLKGTFAAIEILVYPENGLLNGLELVAEATALLLLLLGVLRP